MTNKDKLDAAYIFDKLMKKERERADRYIEHNPEQETRRRTQQSIYNAALADFWGMISDLPTTD